MKNLLNTFGLLLLLFSAACNQQGHDQTMAYDQAVEVAPSPPAVMDNREMQEEAPAPQQPTSPIDRKLIKDGSVAFETEDLAASRNTVLQAVQKHKGYVASEQEYKQADRVSNTIVVRVPSAAFEQFLADATAGITRFDHKQIGSNDVTEEFLDIEARLKTKKELEARYLELLKKAQTVKDMLEIERQIGNLRAEIESIEGRLKYLQNQVSLSTLTFTFYQRVPEAGKFDNKFSDGFRNGWENLVWFFVALVNLWPFLLIGVGVLVGWKVWRKRR